jgi:hypothetical protein
MLILMAVMMISQSVTGGSGGSLPRVSAGNFHQGNTKEREGQVAETGNKTCLDCFHCKVSAKSRANDRLCYCGKAKKDVRHRELYWRMKKACEDFEDMR